MKIKASDLEKQWGEDLKSRGVFDTPQQEGKRHKISGIECIVPNCPDIEQESKGWEEELGKTKLIRMGGQYFECCEYEEMVNEVLNFIHQELERQKQKYEKKLKELNKKCNIACRECDKLAKDLKQTKERVKGEISEKIVKLKKKDRELEPKWENPRIILNEINFGFNQAIDEILNLINP